jgi:hypothetical protein
VSSSSSRSLSSPPSPFSSPATVVNHASPQQRSPLPVLTLPSSWGELSSSKEHAIRVLSAPSPQPLDKQQQSKKKNKRATNTASPPRSSDSPSALSSASTPCRSPNPSQEDGAEKESPRPSKEEGEGGEDESVWKVVAGSKRRAARR